MYTIHINIEDDSIERQEAVRILMEALSEFMHRRGMSEAGVEEYVAKRYDYCNDEDKAKHVKRVMRRVRIAHELWEGVE